MKESTFPLSEDSIADIFIDSQESRTYLIPIYQRNYAWEEDEITTLVNDVYDSMRKSPNSAYYIGTLVTYKRGDNVYEVIDGQQRLTTIFIILKALKQNITSKLTYSARKGSSLTIQNLDNYPDLGERVDEGIRNGYQYALKSLKSHESDDAREKFLEYFLNHVHIIHYNVPKDVDLNHYFEVMNSRGEQLEKHEIVKSMLSQYLKNKSEMATFSRVWEACSEMNLYIQQAFPEAGVFGKHLNQFNINNFHDIPEQDSSDGKESILNLLNQPIKQHDDNFITEQTDKFQPIIDFPNFLLIVLKVTMMSYNSFAPNKFILDDKELLKVFEDALEVVSDEAEFARLFAFNLLKAKFFLDNYVVHHSVNSTEIVGDNPWKLQYLYRETTRKQYAKNLSSDLDVQKELVHLLSMFEVTFTPKQRKNYLFYCMVYLFENWINPISDYLIFLQELANKYFYGVYLDDKKLNERKQPKPNAFDDVLLKDGRLNLEEVSKIDVDYRNRFMEIYQQGKMDISLYVFNYTDYRLWKKYSDELRGNKTKKDSKERIQFFDELGCSDFEMDPFNTFYFSRTRKSLEHFYPQAKAGDGKVMSPEDINCFGNFAMIGAEANSSGSNWNPRTKLDHYCDDKADQISVASLKFKIMMQVCLDNYKAMVNGGLQRSYGMEWNVKDIKNHQDKMLNLLIGEYCNSNTKNEK